MGEDFSIMRTTTIPDMLKIISINSNRKIPEASLFELSYVYIPVESAQLPDEKETLTVGLYGGDADFFVLKGALEQLLKAMGIAEYEFKAETKDPTFHPGRTARLFLNIKGENRACAILGEIHPVVSEKNECPQRTYIAVADVPVLIEASTTGRQYRQLPRFPAVTRDLAIVVKNELYVADLISVIRQKGGQYLEDVQLFDIYKGAQVPAGMKSAAFALSFRASDRTLKDEDVNSAMERILKSLEKVFGAQLR
jgi:phenylalanyl-tRNA synthetase beta chain